MGKKAGRWKAEPSRDARIAFLCATLKGHGFLTYEEQSGELNRVGERTTRGRMWNAQSLYLCCRRHRLCAGGARVSSRETHDLLDGRWRNQLREKILELKSFGVTRYEDLADGLSAERITTRLGKAWSRQSVLRLMKSIGLPTGKPGRRRRDE